MLILIGHTPIMLPICPSPNNDNDNKEDITWKGIIAAFIIIGIISFIIYKLLEYGLYSN